jgi:oligopeptide transport system ATP-binding protein
MIFQEPMTSLDPLYTIGDQMAEPLIRHRGLGRRREGARAGTARSWSASRSRAPHRSYPHELSGGQRQRVMIAMAIANDPRTADRRRADDGARRDDPGADPRRCWPNSSALGMAIVFISHDLGIVRRFADRVYVMRSGEVVEQGDRRIFERRARLYQDAAGRRADRAQGAGRRRRRS